MGGLFGWRDVLYVTPPMLAAHVARTASARSPHPVRTDWIYGVEGDFVAVFQQVTHPLLTQFFIAVYLLVYPAFLLGTYYLLKRHDRQQSLEYVLTYTVVIVVATPFFYLIPVGVTGHYLETVSPLLYGYQGVGPFMYSIDTLRKAFPSLHAGLSLTATLHTPAKYARLSWATTTLILLSTLYLGIHWGSDLLFGVVLAVLCYRATPLLASRLRAWVR